MRTRQCVNPKPQFGGKLCNGPNATAMRGCTDKSRCHQGIWQILKKKFVYYPTLRAFSWSVPFTAYSQRNFWPHCCLLACSPRVIGAHIVVLTQHGETCEGKKKRKLNYWSCFSNVNASGVLFLQFSKQEKMFLFPGSKIYGKVHLFLQLRTMNNQSSLNLFLDFSVRFLTMKGFPSRGSMQILSNGTWKDLCITNWNDAERNLVCQEQGYIGSSLGVYSNSGTNGSGNTSHSCEQLTQNCEEKTTREIKCSGIKIFLSPQNESWMKRMWIDTLNIAVLTLSIKWLNPPDSQ